ncbi:MAG TPA: histidine kinase [Bacillota bacterium]|nr:histidine kinase [Bacillota bacterium]
MKRSAEEAIHSEIAFLQAQIKLHFLYNALNTISSLCNTDSEKAGEITVELAHYLRSHFDFYNLEKFVSLQKELSYINSYLNIVKIRFGDRLQVECDIMDDLVLQIPPLILQPIVENAIKHGLKDRRDGGLVKIAAFKDGMKTIISISDNGKGMSQEEIESILTNTKKSGVGIKKCKLAIKKDVRERFNDGQRKRKRDYGDN